MKTTKFIAAAVFLIGCTQKSTHTSETESLALLMFEAFNQHDWKKMAGYYAEDAEFLDPSLGKAFVRQSREATAAKYADMQKVFPDIRDEVSAVHVAGDAVIVQFTSRGTMADSSAFELPIVTVLTFRDGLIVRDATYYDLENP
jgi:ketosteroid isomerase-like protein